MNRNRRIFIIVFILFTAVVILLTIDMARQTKAPWNKSREAERAFPAGKGTKDIDTLSDDTLLTP